MSRNFELLQRLGTTIGGMTADVRHVLDPTQEQVTTVVDEPRAVLPTASEDLPIRELLQGLFLTNPKGPRVVLFMPTDSKEQGNHTAARAAELLARSVAAQVCIVNLHEDDSASSLYFGDSGGAGLRESLREPFGLGHYLVPLQERNLFLMRRGRVESNGVGRDEWIQRFVQLRTRFDYVLIDAPPSAKSAETLLAAQLSDGVVVIVEANATKREQAAGVCEKLQSSKVKVLGAVLNNRTFPIPNGIYSRL
jgi:polysaccharide biosynthesis transport protein